MYIYVGYDEDYGRVLRQRYCMVCNFREVLIFVIFVVHSEVTKINVSTTIHAEDGPTGGMGKTS